MTIEIFEELIGKEFSDVINIKDRVLYFKFVDDSGYIFYHNQDCCEDVYIEDICGYFDDLTNAPILSAELVGGESKEDENSEKFIDWYFYKFSTIKGSVTVRWCGTSNGYYSTRVKLKKIENVLDINDLS